MTDASTDPTIMAARHLLEARAEFRRLEALADDVRPATIEQGYAVQWAGHRLAGRSLGPWKVGATTTEVQGVLGVDGPFLGRPEVDRVVPSKSELVLADWFAGPPVIEIEVGLVPTVDLVDVGDDPLALAELVEFVPTIELVNSRFGDMTTVGAPSLIADNAVASAIVAGERLGWSPEQIRALDELSIRLEIDGVERAAGTGAMALGHPLNVLHFAAKLAASWATPIRAGELVITGTCTGVVDGEAGMHVSGHFGGKSVEVSFA